MTKLFYGNLTKADRDIRLGKKEIQYGSPINGKFQLIHGDFQNHVSQEEHYGQEEIEETCNDLKNKHKSRTQSDYQWDALSRRDEALASLANIKLRAPLGNKVDQQNVNGQTRTLLENHEDQQNVAGQTPLNILVDQNNGIDQTHIVTIEQERDDDNQNETTNNHCRSCSRATRALKRKAKQIIFFIVLAALVVCLWNCFDYTEPVRLIVSAHVAFVESKEYGSKTDTALSLNNKDGVSSSSVQHVEGVTLLENGFQIMHPGLYQVYYSVYIRLDGNETCIDFENKFTSYILRTNLQNLSIRNILLLSTEMCENSNDFNFKKTINMSGNFQLNIGDLVQLIWPSDIIPIYFHEESSFLGLYYI